MHTTKARASVDLYRYVTSLARAGLDNAVCFTELIDNCLDARATYVRVIVRNGKEISVRDNGLGIPDVTKLVEFGGHVSHRTTRSGMYGVGFKDAVLVLGGESSRVTIQTSCEGKRSHCTIAWQLLKETEECMSIDSEPDISGETGTLIKVQPLEQRFPDGERRERLLSHLGYIYSPAIKRGVVIQFIAGGKTTDLVNWKMPPLEDIVDVRIDIGGKKARLYAGVVKRGERNERPGLTYLHGFRVIKRAGSDGCGTWSPARICGFVEIDEAKGWHRTKNKTDLVAADNLYEEVERLLTPMLKKAAEHSHTIDIDGLNERVEAMLSEALFGHPDEKAKRGHGEQSGRKDPTGKGGKHTKAKETQAGTTFGRRKVNSIRLDFRPEGWSPGELPGMLETNNKIATIVLYLDNPSIRQAQESRNLQALVFAAMTVISVSRDTENPSQLGFVDGRRALVQFGEYLSRIGRLDSQALALAAE